MIKNDCFSLPCCCVNSYIHFYSACKLLSYLINILTQDVWLKMNNSSSLHLLLYELTCAFICAHAAAKLLSHFVHILTQDVWLRMIALLSTCCCVNSCIHLRSACKLLSYLVNILTQDVCFKMNDFSSLYLLLRELTCALICAHAAGKLLSYLVNILT